MEQRVLSVATKMMASAIRRGSAVLALLMVPAGVGAQEENELDRFMAQVLQQQGENAERGLDYVFDERAEGRMTGPDGEGLIPRDYTWYARDGVFVRSPIRVDGVAIGAEERRAYETMWLESERQRRTRRSAAREGNAEEPVSADDALMLHWMFSGLAQEAAQAASDSGDDEVEPRFVGFAFVDVLFESGNYYLVGRETLNGQDVLRIEYYPERLAPHSGDDDQAESDAEIDAGMSKTLRVTLWVDPAQHQIVRYSFDNLGFAFMPGRWMFRLEDVAASMSMRQPFAGVWLPAQIEVRMVIWLATGRYEFRLTRTFANYREAVTGGRVLVREPR